MLSNIINAYQFDELKGLDRREKKRLMQQFHRTDRASFHTKIMFASAGMGISAVILRPVSLALFGQYTILQATVSGAIVGALFMVTALPIMNTLFLKRRFSAFMRQRTADQSGNEGSAIKTAD